MADVQAILERLLVPDNDVIQQATRDLQAVYRNPEIIPGLCSLLHSSPNPQIRQFAAVLLRKRVVKIWKRLSQADQASIKVLLLQCIAQEKVHIVFLSVAHLTSVIAKHELPRQRWEELSSFIFQYCHSQDPTHREVGMLLLSSIMETAALDFKQHFKNLFHLFSSSLEDSQSKNVPFYTLKCLTSMVEFLGEEDVLLFSALVPKAMAVVEVLTKEDEDKACEAMEVFDEMAECEAVLMSPHLPPLLQLSLRLATNVSLGDNLRVKALCLLQWLASLKKRTLLKHGLLPSILQSMLTIMATPPTSNGQEKEEEEEREEGEGEEQLAESTSPISLAAQVLDILSLHLPPEKILSPVLQLVTPWLDSPNPFQRSAALIAIAVMVEGCSIYIKNNHLPALLQVVYKAMRDEHRVVRNAALFAIGQFSEHLQPQIAAYSEDLLPVLLQLVDQALLSPGRHTSALTKIFYALETFSEQLGPKLVPYLPALMEKLFLALTTQNSSVHIRELAISSIGAAANACEQQMVPYFEKSIQILKEYISLPYHQDTVVLQAQAVDTLGTLARTLNKETFRPLALECVTMGIALTQNQDPDLRRSVYGMFASVSCVLGEEMAGHLDSVVGCMLQALQSEDGMTVHYAPSEVPFLDFDEDEEEEENGEGGGEDGKDASFSMLDDSRAIEGYSVENAYLEEKEDACNALAEIAENVGPSFLQYIDDCFRESNALTEHSHEGIRKASIHAVSQFCWLWYKWLSATGSTDLRDVEYLIDRSILSLAAIARTDSDRHVVGTALEAIENLLKPLRGTGFTMSEQARGSVLVSLQDIFNNKAQCYGTEEEVEENEEEEMSEYDCVVVECAGNVIGPLAAVVGGDAILTSLPSLLSPLIDRLKPTSTTADRSFAVGTLAELVDGIGSHASSLLDLYPLFAKAMSDEDDEVCSNAVYGMGLLAANGGVKMHNHYHEVLQTLFTVAQSRKNARILDNICAAIARMILAHMEGVPLEQVVPTLLRHLPLKEDMEEVVTVYRCILHLFHSTTQTMLSNLPAALRVVAEGLTSDHITLELKLKLAQLVQVLNSQHVALLQASLPHLTPSHITTLTNALHHPHPPQ